MDARGVQAIRPSKCDLQKKTNWCKLPSYLAERCGKKQKSTTSNCLHPPGTSPFYLEGGRFFQPFGGEVENQLPPQGLEKWGGNKNFPPRVPKYGGEIKIFPGGKNLIFSPEESEIPKNFRLRRAIFQIPLFLYEFYSCFS